MKAQEKKPLVSIIVPVYNVEKYLDQCVDSILAQTLTNIEIILVDDGSTDNSGNMCDAYMSDPRVKVIHKENGGASEARNVGVAASLADYIGFIDSDDYIEKDMFELLYANMIEYDADISLCGVYDVFAYDIRMAYSLSEGKIVADAKKAIELVMHGKIASVCPVNKLYKKTLLAKHPFMVGKTSEDAHFIIPYLTEINKAIFDMTPKYYYVHRDNTVTTKPYQAIDLSIIEAYINNKKIIEERYPDLIELANFRYYWSLFFVIDKMIRTNSYGEQNDYQIVAKKIKGEYLHIMKNQYVGRARKIAVTGLMVHKKLYEICLQYYLKQKKQLVKD